MGKILIGVLVLALAWFLFLGGKKDNSVKNEMSQDEITQAEKEKEIDSSEDSFSEKTSITALMKKGGNYMCTMSHSTDVGDTKGTVYIAKEKIRGDFTTQITVPGMKDMGNIDTHMISDGESTYTWSSASAEGFKGPIDSESQTGETSQVPKDENLDYKCVAWNVDDSKFILPTNITFKQI